MFHYAIALTLNCPPPPPRHLLKLHILKPPPLFSTCPCQLYVFVSLTPDQKKLKYLIEPPVYPEVIARRGENASLPCILQTKPSHYKVKWTKMQPENPGPENIVLISNGYAYKLYGLLGPRVSLRNAHTMDASLHIHHLELEDGGRYRCELINGIEDESVFVTLRIEGKMIITLNCFKWEIMTMSQQL